MHKTCKVRSRSRKNMDVQGFSNEPHSKERQMTFEIILKQISMYSYEYTRHKQKVYLKFSILGPYLEDFKSKSKEFYEIEKFKSEYYCLTMKRSANPNLKKMDIFNNWQFKMSY